MQIRNLGSIGTKPMIVNLIGSLLTNIPEYKDKRIFAIFTYAFTHHNVIVVILSRLYFTHDEKVYCWFEIEAFTPLKILN